MRDGAEDPAQFAAVGIESADVAGRTGQSFGNGAAKDDGVLKNYAGAAGADGDVVGRAVQALPQIDAAVIAKIGDGLAGRLVQRPEKIAVREEDAILIYGDAAIADVARDLLSVIWIEVPDLHAGFGVEGHHAKFGSGGVEDAIDDDGIALHLRIFEGIVRVVGPGNLQAGDIAGRDLLQSRVADVVRAAVDAPFDIGSPGGER